MRRFDAVIFDMDGLLLDTERVARAAFVDTCEQLGIGEHQELFIQCIGTDQALAQQVLKDGLRGKADPFVFDRLWNARYVEYVSANGVPLKEGATAILDQLALLRIPAAVATSTKLARATRKLGDAGLLDRIKAVIGGDQVSRGKPDPEIYVKAATTLGVSPGTCLALEDSENGVRSAVGAGMTVVQIPDLVPPSPELRALGHLVLGSLNDVMCHVFGGNS